MRKLYGLALPAYSVSKIFCASKGCTLLMQMKIIHEIHRLIFSQALESNLMIFSNHVILLNTALPGAKEILAQMFQSRRRFLTDLHELKGSLSENPLALARRHEDRQLIICTQFPIAFMSFVSSTRCHLRPCSRRFQEKSRKPC